MSRTPIQKAKDALSGKSTARKLKKVESGNRTLPKKVVPKGPKKKKKPNAADKLAQTGAAARQARITEQKRKDKIAIKARQARKK
jgi:hypothetical protein